VASSFIAEFKALSGVMSESVVSSPSRDLVHGSSMSRLNVFGFAERR
jgi:hypothetical protein